MTYISDSRLPKSWKHNEVCPVPPELVIEIISPGQSLKDFEDKAKDYFGAGVSLVWVVDPEAISITVFFPELTPLLVFEQAELLPTVEAEDSCH